MLNKLYKNPNKRTVKSFTFLWKMPVGIEIILIFVVSNLKYFLIMAKNEQTSKKVATKASKLLSNPKTPANVKSVAASALTQAPDRKKPSKKGK